MPFAVAGVLTVLVNIAHPLHWRSERIAGYCFLFGAPWGWLFDRGWSFHTKWLDTVDVYVSVLWGPAVLYAVCLWILVRGCLALSRQAVFFTLTPKNELLVWIVCACAAGLAFLASHTFYVTAGTYANGSVLLGITAFLFWMRFRRRQTPRTKSLTLTSNGFLVLLTLLVVLYLLGVATWYE